MAVACEQASPIARVGQHDQPAPLRRPARPNSNRIVEARAAIAAAEAETGLPADDAIRFGAGKIECTARRAVGARLTK